MTLPNSSLMRAAILRAYAAGVAAVDGERVTADWLRRTDAEGPFALIALGKAASAMARGAQEVLGKHLLCGLVVTKAGLADTQGLDTDRIRICEGSHPIPDDRSLAAGQAVLDFVADLSADMPVLVLISGGASALVEVLQPGVELSDLKRVTDWLLANGRPIDEINAVRRRLSRLKGGGLAALLMPRPVTGLLISDVAGDDPAVIGSGPLSSPLQRNLPADLPDWLLNLLPPESALPVKADPQIRVVATLDDALHAAEQAVLAEGLQVQRHLSHLDGNLGAVAAHIAEVLRERPGTIHVWGGETTVVLPPDPGRGGRNQQLALALATNIAGEHPAVALCAGTDGSDGPTDDAGALVDESTVRRGEIEGLDADDHLTRADAGTFLEQTGDLVTTGPTGTNVTDLVIAWRV